MTKKLNLDIQSILDKEFHTDFKGYDPVEVDAFVDLMIEDYQAYQETIKQLHQQNTELEQSNAGLRAKLIELEGKLRAKEDEVSAAVIGASNVDTLKRISRLEEELLAVKEQIRTRMKENEPYGAVLKNREI